MARQHPALRPVDDPEYCVSGPFVYGKIEGRGNGLRTVVANLSETATILRRAPDEVCKFLGCELDAKTAYSSETGRAVVSDVHTDEVLRDLMDVYVEKFVLCPRCHLSETSYSVDGERIFLDCAHCAAREMVDTSHKLCGYILTRDKKAKKNANKEAKSKYTPMRKDKNQKHEKKKSGRNKEEQEKKRAKEQKRDQEKKKSSGSASKGGTVGRTRWDV